MKYVPSIQPQCINATSLSSIPHIILPSEFKLERIPSPNESMRSNVVGDMTAHMFCQFELPYHKL